MRYKELLYQGKTYTDKYKIDEILVKHKMNWVLDAELENVRIEILKDTFIFNSGIWYNGVFKYGVVRSGEFRYAIIENCVWFNGMFWDGVFKSGLIYNGTFYKGQILGGEVKKTMPRTGHETKQHFMNCEISKNVKGIDMENITNETRLYRRLDQLVYRLNESESINEGRIFDSIKRTVKSYIENNKKYILDKLPNLLEYIKKSPISKIGKKDIFFFIAVSLYLAGANMVIAREKFQKMGVDTEVNWTRVEKRNRSINVDSIAPITFDIGEYTISPSVVREYYEKIKSLIPESTGSIRGEFVVTISDDAASGNPMNRNIANDDTPADIDAGGKLLDKRIENANTTLVNRLKSLFKRDGIAFDMTVEGAVESDRIGYIKSLTAEGSKSVDYDGLIGGVDNNFIPDSTATTTPTGGGFKDISQLSRNYQYVELLKLGDINAKRFNGDKIETGDEYSLWIVDTRKHIKEFLIRLKKAYPEYNIEFDMTSVAITPVKGSTTGMSNVGRQYTNVKERYVMQFESYVAADDAFATWKKILGSKFPALTTKQAMHFHKNIKVFLNYLEQMYGNSVLEFRVS